MSDEKCNLEIQAIQFHLNELKKDSEEYTDTTDIRLTKLEQLAEDIRAVKFVAYGIGLMVLSQTIGLTEVIKVYFS